MIFPLLTTYSCFLQAQCRCMTLRLFLLHENLEPIYICFIMTGKVKMKWGKSMSCLFLTAHCADKISCSLQHLVSLSQSLVFNCVSVNGNEHWTGTVHECSSISCLGWSSVAKLPKPCQCSPANTASRNAPRLIRISDVQCRCSSCVHWEQAPNHPLFSSVLTLILLKGIEHSGIGSSEN